MTYSWYDLLGTIGVAVIVLTYVLLQAERIRSEQLSYSLLNAAGRCFDTRLAVLQL